MSALQDVHRLFDSLRGRKLAYTPLQIAKEFEAYVSDIQKHPIVKKTVYTKDGDKQLREEHFDRPPMLSDFVCRWLGKSLRWWSELSLAKDAEIFEAVKESISEYCRNIKMGGAYVGIYNANIVARDLGLAEKMNVEATTPSITFTGTLSEEDKAKL
jgi:hypothetical protein